MRPFEEIKSNPKLEIVETTLVGGIGILHMPGLKRCSIIWSFNDGWEHVSLSPKNRTATWEEMCEIKDMFWGKDETVIQFHPAKEDYVNIDKYCLHLWKPVEKFVGKLPIPPKHIV